MSGTPRIPYDAIRERAYELWERHHRIEGFEMEFWLLAERELKAEQLRQQDDAQPDERLDLPPAPNSGREEQG